MSLKTLFRPTKQIIFADIILALLIVAIYSFIFALTTQQSINYTIISFIFGSATAFILYYPLACGLVFVFGKIVKKAKTESFDLAVAILLVLLWNPIAPIIIFAGLGILNSQVMNYPCGVQIIGFQQSSPARDQGMKIGDIIRAVDGTQIANTEEFVHAMTNKNAGDHVILTTKTTSYDITLISDAENRAVMGIIVTYAYCAR